MAKPAQPPVIPPDLMAELLAALPAKAPAPRRASVMRAALLEKVKAADTDQILLRAGTGDWINFAPSVDMRILFDDGQTRSWLARFGRGGTIPSHIQTGDEEAIVLQGWCYLGDEKICAGDYHRIGKGRRHGKIVSPEGCLIFVRSHSARRHASELMPAR
ncbi:cupin domain-containing protein [Casimicrobium huifangae]|uniref:cupin domain-containing protein n=1 Tax=Casimicrobium huifangae TaxID=2591109 RepID=UPI00378503E6